jgi:hypothetical protein
MRNIERWQTIRRPVQGQLGDILETLSHIMEVVFSISRGFHSVWGLLEMELPTSVNNQSLLSKLEVGEFAQVLSPLTPLAD